MLVYNVLLYVLCTERAKLNVLCTLMPFNNILCEFYMSCCTQGTDDGFLPKGQLLPDNLVAACATAKVPITMRMQEVRFSISHVYYCTNSLQKGSQILVVPKICVTLWY